MGIVGAVDVERMDGRLVLVTGAGSGIGRETALLCARRGANLALCDVNEDGLAATEAEAVRLGSEVMTGLVDVGDRAQMQAFADSVHERAEAVDLLVNNAGVGVGARFLETQLEDWDWILPINLMGVVHGCHMFVPAMVERGRGGLLSQPHAGGVQLHQVRGARSLGGAAHRVAPARGGRDRCLPGADKYPDHSHQPAAWERRGAARAHGPPLRTPQLRARPGRRADPPRRAARSCRYAGDSRGVGDVVAHALRALARPGAGTRARLDRQIGGAGVCYAPVRPSAPTLGTAAGRR